MGSLGPARGADAQYTRKAPWPTTSPEATAIRYNVSAVRILHLYKAYPPIIGGIENTVELLAEAQAAAGHEVTVVVSSPDRWTRRETRNGVRVVRVARLLELASTPLSPGLPLAVRRLRPDIAHLHAPYPPAEVANLVFGRARRTVITWHSDVVRQQRILRLYAPVLERVLQRAHRIFPTSAAYLRRSPFLQPVASRCRVIPLGIHLEPFASPEPSGAARLRLRWSGPPRGHADRARPVILFVGRLRAYKGLPYLLEALTRIDANLVIAGDGPEAGSLRARCRELRLTDRVHFAGHLPEDQLPAAYQAADVFVLPSHLPSEAFGLVLVEAMASGLPVICTELGTGTSEVIRHDETGLVVPPADPSALALALERLLADPALRQRLGAAGRQRAQAEFSAPVYVERTQRAYEDVLAHP